MLKTEHRVNKVHLVWSSSLHTISFRNQVTCQIQVPLLGLVQTIRHRREREREILRFSLDRQKSISSALDIPNHSLAHFFATAQLKYWGALDFCRKTAQASRAQEKLLPCNVSSVYRANQPTTPTDATLVQCCWCWPKTTWPMGKRKDEDLLCVHMYTAKPSGKNECPRVVKEATARRWLATVNAAEIRAQTRHSPTSSRFHPQTSLIPLCNPRRPYATGRISRKNTNNYKHHFKY